MDGSVGRAATPPPGDRRGCEGAADVTRSADNVRGLWPTHVGSASASSSPPPRPEPSGPPRPARPRTSATPRCSCPTTSATSWRPLPAMMAAADATTELQVGALVFDNDYKHPVVLAKELATIDVLSGGRVEVGLGAGWMNTDYEQSGIPMDPPGVRVDRMEEGIAVLKGCFGRRPVQLQGRALHDHRLRRPAQAGAVAHRPILIGGGREAGAVDRRPRGRHRRHQPVDPQRRRSTPTPPGTAPPPRPTRSWPGCARQPATATPTSRSTCCSSRHRHRRPRRHGRDDGAPVRHATAELETTRTPDRHGRADLRRPRSARRERWDASYIVFQGDAMEAMAPVVAALRGT